MLYFYLYMMMFLSSCFMFSFNFKHILLTLINLEFMMINTIYMTYLMLMINMINPYFMFFILTLMISEGVMGLTILVYMISNSGNDYSTILKMMKW